MGQQVSAIGFDLHNADLSGLNLKSADFSKANLKGVNFSGANLSKALFSQANLSKANFSRAKLIEADLNDANINGASFKGAKLHGIKYYYLRSAKGTVFEDRYELLKRLTREQKIYEIKQGFLIGEVLSIPISTSSSLKVIHEALYKRLKELHKYGQEYTVLDFRTLSAYNEGLKQCSHNLTEINQVAIIQECLEFLQAPFFRESVKSITSICNSQALIVFLQNENITLPTKKLYSTLDLHGDAPLKIKYNWIDKFIKQSHRRHLYAIEIITGRGLHNPQGKMGILWNLCQQYLTRKDFQPYIQEIYPVHKQGGWKIILKNVPQERIVRNKPSNTVTISGAHPPFKNPKLILIPPKPQIKPAVSKKRQKLKTRSSNTIGNYIKLTNLKKEIEA
jgi:pentapeptide repeat protein/Smr domain-containing protein